MMTREVTPHVHISEKHVQNTSNSTFHLFKKKTKKKPNSNSFTVLAQFDPTLFMYSFSALKPTLPNIVNKVIHSNKTLSNNGVRYDF